MKINLKEITDEGQTFNYTRKTGEFNSVLDDLIHHQNYNIDFTLRPINSRDYELIGTLKTATREDCSKCGLAFDFSIDEKYHEILIPPQPEDRHGRYSKVNHISESAQSGPSSHEYSEGGIFNAGEYIHELIGLAIPLNPLPKPVESGACSVCGDDKFSQDYKYEEGTEEFKPKNPFVGLKNVKI